MTSEKLDQILSVMQRQRRETLDREEVLSRREAFNARFFSDNFRNVQVAAMPSLLVPGFLIDLFCFGYPAFFSLKALKGDNGADIVQWICYWIISAFFMVLERYAYFFTIIPFYTTLRRAVCIWCLLPIPNNGAVVIYNNIFRRLLNNEAPSDVFRDVSRQLSFETLQRRAKELKEAVLSKMRTAQPELVAAAENAATNALETIQSAGASSQGQSN